MRIAGRPCPDAPTSPRPIGSLGQRWLWLGLALSLSGCGEHTSPQLREPLVLVHGEALVRLLDRAVLLEGTPIAREARGLRARLADCPTVWGHFSADPDDDHTLEGLRCLEPSDTHSELHSLAATRRGEHAGWLQWPLGEDGRLELRLDLDADDDLTLSGSLDPPSDPGALALLLPGPEPPAPPAIEPSQTLIHARARPAAGLGLSSLIPAGGQADRLFALKGRLLEGALLSGTWEIAFMPPAVNGSLPLVVAALHHRLEAPIRQAVDEALDQLERTWPIRRTPRRFDVARQGSVEGGCFLELPLLPELAPCWAVTSQALVVGYRAEALEAALSAPDVTSPPRESIPIADLASASGLDIRFDRVRRIDRLLAPDSNAPRPSDLWSRFQLRLEALAQGQVTLWARLEARR